MFVHLHCHSHYSFLRGVPSPQELVAAAAEQKMSAVALTDTNGLYTALPFYQAAQEAGIKPIVGAVLDIEWRETNDERRNSKIETRNSAAAKILLLAADRAGYSNLCRLVTWRQIEERPVTLEELNAHREGLIALWAPDVSQPESRSFGRRSSAASGLKANSDLRMTPAGCIAALKEIFGGALWLEAQRLSPGDGRALRETLRISKELGVPVAATNNVHFIHPEEHLHHRVLNAIRTGTLLSKIAPPEIVSTEAYFKSADEMQRAFADHPEALQATLEIAERCNLELELGKTIFPEFPVPQGETPFSYLWKLCFEGAQKRYQPLRPEVLARLTHELEVINKLHLAPYFLLVWEIVEEARRRDIPAVARGSAASSMVTYCLGISRVCPLRWGLYFERFLNEQRGDVPDIDIDICGARRDELLDYVYKRWGAEHVAMIACFVTMHARMAVREVAKVFGIAPAEVNHFTRRLPHRPVREILEAIRTLPECRALPAQEEPWRTVLQVALRLDNFPRHLGIHPCGTVIAAHPLNEMVPLEWATKGIVVTQYDMHAIEALGLVKMDLLGQRGLTTMSLALKNIEQIVGQEGTASSTPTNAKDFDAIPEGDPATCGMIARGRTMGIFQIESPGMRGLLRALGSRNGRCHSESAPALKPRAEGLRSKNLDEQSLHGADIEILRSSPFGHQWPQGRRRPQDDTVSSSAFSLEEICLALALIRPGAAEYGSKELFLKRLRGQAPLRFPHPSTEPILRETLGICVYQEQVMQLAQVAGGMSLAEADIVRRASAKFADDRERERLRSKFLKAAERLGLTGSAREETWQMVEKFAGFGFCKAHAATYADLSYRMAYLKAHYPAEFLTAMCSSGAGFYHVSAYVEEAKRWGIEVRLPSVNDSRVEYTAEGCGGARAMRIGLMQVKGLRAETMAAMVHSREERGPYRSLEDFLARVPVERDEIESLIKCGAFDEVGEPGMRPTRPELLWQLNLFNARGPASLSPAEEMLFPDSARNASVAEALPLLAPYTREQRLRYEQEILEVCVSGHPLDSVPRNGEAWSTDIYVPCTNGGINPPLQGKRITLLGWTITFRRVGTKNYRNMMFVTLEDQRGVYEVVLFPEAYERYGGLVFESRTLRVTGRVEAEGQINCEKLEAVKR